MKKAPCTNCDKCGCGAYHDKCTEYQEWLKECKAATDSIRHNHIVTAKKVTRAPLLFRRNREQWHR